MAIPLSPLLNAFNGEGAPGRGIEPQKEMASVAGGGATDAIMVRPALGGGDPVLLSRKLGGVWFCDEPSLVGGGARLGETRIGKITRLVELASLGLASHERNVRTGDAKIVQLTGGELAEFIDGVAVTAPVVVRAKQVHRAIPSSLRNWSSVQF